MVGYGNGSWFISFFQIFESSWHVAARYAASPCGAYVWDPRAQIGCLLTSCNAGSTAWTTWFDDWRSSSVKRHKKTITSLATQMTCEPSSVVLESRRVWWSYDRSSRYLARPWPKGWDILRRMASIKTYTRTQEPSLFITFQSHAFRLLFDSSLLKPDVCDDVCSSRLATWSPKDKTRENPSNLVTLLMLRYSATPNLRQVNPSSTFWVRCL